MNKTFYVTFYEFGCVRVNAKNEQSAANKAVKRMNEILENLAVKYYWGDTPVVTDEDIADIDTE